VATDASIPAIRAHEISKLFFSHGTRVVALEDISLSIAHGEFVAIVGPSGCGKSTLLNIFAGIERPELGSAWHRGNRIDGIDPTLGYMTQKDTLLPWRTAIENVELPLAMRGVGRDERRQRAQAVIDRVGLHGFEKHMPTELSGGMLKRAALARMLVFNPDTMLMDEPFGNVDAQLRIQLHRELAQIWQDQGGTIVFVTHDLEEALSLSDRVVILSPRPGRIARIVNVDLPRPRDPATIRFDAHFQELHRQMWALVEESTKASAEQPEEKA
jgi:NitT/TauT family transport system ATP-binding protein